MRYRSDDIPPFRLHKASGRGYVHLDGQRRYLGPYDEPATREAYAPPDRGMDRPRAVGW